MTSQEQEISQMKAAEECQGHMTTQQNFWKPKSKCYDIIAHTQDKSCNFYQLAIAVRLMLIQVTKDMSITLEVYTL